MHKKSRVTHNALPCNYVCYFVFNGTDAPIDCFNAAMPDIGYFQQRLTACP
jgi:hypothetical protein